MIQYIARYNATDFCIIDIPSITDSSKETTFSDFTIDFTGYTDEDLPIQYQEIKIIKKDGITEELISNMYVDNVEYPEFQFEAQPFLLKITTISAYAYSSKRTVSIQVNNVSLDTAILTVLQPLLDDGFTIEENELKSTDYMSEIYSLESVEKVMNELANKFKFIWYIDKEKKIYLKDIGLLQNQNPSLAITVNNKYYLQKIKPYRTIVDYCNKLNIKNAILVTPGQLLKDGLTLRQGDSYTFLYPISVSENVCFRLKSWNGFDEFSYAFYMITDLGGATEYYIKVDYVAKTITYSAEIGFSGQDDDDPTIKILLETDPTDVTKITGFKWNSASETLLIYNLGLISFTQLIPYLISYIDPVEINKNKTKLNTSGIIEKIVDANGKYFVEDELQNYALALLSQNNIQTYSIDATFKGLLSDTDFLDILDNLKITKFISVNLPDFNITGSFIITNTEYSSNRETATLKISARNYNLSESYLDIYRKPLEQENEDKLTRKLVTLYNQDDKTVLNKEIIVNGEVVNDV